MSAFRRFVGVASEMPSLGRMRFSVAAALLVGTLSGPALADAPAGFTVELGDCVESIGVTLVPTANARARVPPPFVLAGEGGPVTPLVVRTARCAALDGGKHHPRPVAVVQIGAVVVPPDFTADIDNYTLWYYTDDAKLAKHLRRSGVAAQHMPHPRYAYEAEGGAELHVEVRRPGDPRLRIDGTVVAAGTPASFVANWWQAGPFGVVKMATSVPALEIGTADLTLTTDPADPLGQLAGSGVLAFPILQQFNGFPHATLHVEIVSP